jgi:uncharacterized membrane protein YfcA
MLRAAIIFFVMGLLFFALGAFNLGAISMDVGRTLLYVFLGLAVLSFVASLVTGKSAKLPPT